MIEVPARVKDALKSGEYAKNVKIEVDGISSVQHTEEHLCDVEGYEGPGGSVAWVGTWLGSIWWGTFDTLKVSMNGADSFTSITMFNVSKTGDDIVVEDGRTCVIFDGSDIYDDPEQSLAITTPGDTYPTLQFDYIVSEIIIDNNNLVAESVKFDERMCSGDELKFGLCEGTSVEFQYFDLPNIREHHISISIDVQYKDTDGTLAWYEIPMGQFDVDECSRQASTGIIKATAYNKLKSAYLDQDMFADIYDYVYDGTSHTRKIVDILNFLLNGYHIEKTDWDEVECKLYRQTQTDDNIFSGMSWDGIYYLDGSGVWKQYEKGYTPEEEDPHYPYDFPTGNRWVVYAADFYYVPVDDNAQSTSHYYKYEDIQIPDIWDIAKENLDWFYDYYGYEPGSLNPHVVKLHTAEPMYLPWFGINDGGAQTFQEYATGLKTSNFNEFICGLIGELNTSVCGYSAPVDIGEFTGTYPVIRLPLAIVVQNDDYIGLYPPNPFNNAAIWSEVEAQYEAMYQALGAVALPKMYRKRLSAIEEETISTSQLTNVRSLTLRDLQSAVFEIDCQYGKLDRVTNLFAGIELNNGALYPRDDLYPADTLLPMGTAEGGYPAMYSKLWADEGNVRTFRYLIITYKGTENGQEVEKKLQRTVNANGTDDYDMSDNWLFKNLVWTDADVGAYADAMVLKMQGISWFPFEMWCAGLPYLESGDEIEIAMQEGAYRSYVLRRTLSGIQNLQDEMINGTLDIF